MIASRPSQVPAIGRSPAASVQLAVGANSSRAVWASPAATAAA